MSLALLPLSLKALLVVTVLTAAAFDLLYRCIPNWLCFAALPLGILGSTLFLGWRGCLASLEGFALAALVYLPLYLFKGMGAGDVKLMMAIGAMVGPLHWLQIFSITALIGAS